MYDLNELEAFVSVVKTGSLTVSTRALNVPKSTLSRRIRSLENSVGQPLLRRESRRITPNEAGRVFYRYSNEILELALQGRSALDELKEEVSGKLILRCHEALVRGWFSELVESFMARYQDIRVSVQTQNVFPESVDDGACVWLGRCGDTTLRLESLGQLSQGIYGSPGYFACFGVPEAPGDLARHAWVDMIGSGDPEAVLQHPLQGVYPLSLRKTAFTADQFVVQGDAIAKGRGLGLMPHWLVERRLEAHPETFLPCLAEWQGPVLPVSLVYPHGILPRRLRAFIHHVRDAVPPEWGASGPCQPSGTVPNFGTHHPTR